MEPATVGYVLDAIHRLWDVDRDAEITLEANPTSVEAQNFKGYRDAGVNRVSMGVQSLHDEQLRFLGRMHDVEQAKYAIKLARDIFPRMSFDLIYARPDQTPQSWSDELNEAIDLAADHLSLYQLTIEQDTMFHKLYHSGKFELPDEDTSVALYEVTHETCEARGLPAYEISNHARPGEESRHNLTYWRYGDYVGVGAGAHGRLTLPNGRVATSNEYNPERWLELVEERETGVRTEEILSLEEQGDEFLVMGLRVKEGISLARYQSLSNRPLNEARLATMIEHGLIEQVSDDRIRATREGFFLLNSVVAELASE
jgi:oxygen-independent coproporphyrinogen-3 oxidase